ncbi:MAG: DUF4007 family protein [Actinomycetota bacterium]
MRLAQAAEESFARHETFHPRWGWFTKAVQRAGEDPEIFLSPDATVRLGVGKNMVRAIKFWGLASRLLTQAYNPDSPRKPQVVVSRIGEALMDDNGLDPYLEDPATLWLLHWLMVAPKTLLPAWWLTFSEFKSVEFKEEDLVEFVADQVEGVAEWGRREKSSIVKDVSCLLRMYAPGGRSHSREGIDDWLDCPFRELGLVAPSTIKHGGHRFILGPKPNLGPCILGFAVFDYLSRTDPETRTATIGRLATDAGSPGRMFKLSEGAISEALELACKAINGVALTSVAGVAQVGFDDDPAIVATRFLYAHYRRTPASSVIAGFAGDLPSNPSFRPNSSKGVALPSLDDLPPSDEALRREWVLRQLDRQLVTVS